MHSAKVRAESSAEEPDLTSEDSESDFQVLELSVTEQEAARTERVRRCPLTPAATEAATAIVQDFDGHDAASQCPYTAREWMERHGVDPLTVAFNEAYAFWGPVPDSLHGPTYDELADLYDIPSQKLALASFRAQQLAQNDLDARGSRSPVCESTPHTPSLAPSEASERTPQLEARLETRRAEVLCVPPDLGCLRVQNFPPALQGCLPMCHMELLCHAGDAYTFAAKCGHDRVLFYQVLQRPARRRGPDGVDVVEVRVRARYLGEATVEVPVILSIELDPGTFPAGEPFPDLVLDSLFIPDRLVAVRSPVMTGLCHLIHALLQEHATLAAAGSVSGSPNAAAAPQIMRIEPRLVISAASRSTVIPLPEYSQPPTETCLTRAATLTACASLLARHTMPIFLDTALTAMHAETAGLLQTLCLNISHVLLMGEDPCGALVYALTALRSGPISSPQSGRALYRAAKALRALIPGQPSNRAAVVLLTQGLNVSLSEATIVRLSAELHNDASRSLLFKDLMCDIADVDFRPGSRAWMLYTRVHFVPYVLSAVLGYLPRHIKTRVARDMVSYRQRRNALWPPAVVQAGATARARADAGKSAGPRGVTDRRFEVHNASLVMVAEALRREGRRVLQGTGWSDENSGKAKHEEMSLALSYWWQALELLRGYTWPGWPPSLQITPLQYILTRRYQHSCNLHPEPSDAAYCEEVLDVMAMTMLCKYDKAREAMWAESLQRAPAAMQRWAVVQTPRRVVQTQVDDIMEPAIRATMVLNKPAENLSASVKQRQERLLAEHRATEPFVFHVHSPVVWSQTRSVYEAAASEIEAAWAADHRRLEAAALGSACMRDWFTALRRRGSLRCQRGGHEDAVYDFTPYSSLPQSFWDLVSDRVAAVRSCGDDALEMLPGLLPRPRAPIAARLRVHSSSSPRKGEPEAHGTAIVRVVKKAAAKDVVDITVEGPANSDEGEPDPDDGEPQGVTARVYVEAIDKLCARQERILRGQAQ